MVPPPQSLSQTTPIQTSSTSMQVPPPLEEQLSAVWHQVPTSTSRYSYFSYAETNYGRSYTETARLLCMSLFHAVGGGAPGTGTGTNTSTADAAAQHMNKLDLAFESLYTLPFTKVGKVDEKNVSIYYLMMMIMIRTST
jgi:hypothetical protein